MSSFRKEIGEQPEVAARLLKKSASIEQIGKAIRAADPVGIMIGARGSSDHAAVYAKYVFQSRNRLPVALAAPSLFTHYHVMPRLAGYCVLGISQSGSSPDVCAVIAEARRQKALTIAITNQPESELAAAAEHVMTLDAGEERSVPASKTYTATLLAIALLSLAIDHDDGFAAGLRAVPGAMRLALEGESQTARMAQALIGERLIVLGRGFHLSTAEELALKLTETSYVLARAWSAADFLHGPIAVVDPSFPVLFIETQGPTFAETRQVATQLLAMGMPVFQLADGSPPLAGATGTTLLQTGLPESLTPITLAIAAQLFAFHLAVTRGLDPDRPRALKKITRTW